MRGSTLLTCLLLNLSPLILNAQGIAQTSPVCRPQMIAINPGEGNSVSTVSGPLAASPLIVIGFMGGRVRADSLIHSEASLASRLQQDYADQVHAKVFANRDGKRAYLEILHALDVNHDGHLTPAEKQNARIIIYGHSWGASETVSLARRLGRNGIGVLLTVQVDSVSKEGQDDGYIPANVAEAVNFYQRTGLLRGRSTIQAIDPAKTRIIGNFELSYKDHPVQCNRYPWYARAFMRSHIEIENDPRVWNWIEAMIQTELADSSQREAQ